jgi:4-aminobutyrate aminotransferase-like enzyme
MAPYTYYPRFRELQSRYAIIGDVRGRGLFFGIDLVHDRTSKKPAPVAAKRIVNEMRSRGILMSKIGEHDNVLKLRPPLCFSTEHADMLLAELDAVLREYPATANE